MSGLIEGYLGCGVRKQLPECVVDGIRETFPNEDGRGYMGYHPTATNDANTVNEGENNE